MLQAAIFDMDGLIVDSEPLWRRTEVAVFGEVGLTLTEAMCEATTGLRIDEVALHWFRRSPWKGPSPHALAVRIVDRMIEHAGTAMQPGVASALEACAEAGLRLAVASSSPLRLIDATLSRLGLRERFGKPHPAVFLNTAEQLGVAPAECLVLEDSLNGVLAAKAARTICVAVPSPSDRADPRFAIADRVLGSLEELDERTIAELAE